MRENKEAPTEWRGLYHETLSVQEKKYRPKHPNGEQSVVTDELRFDSFCSEITSKVLTDLQCGMEVNFGVIDLRLYSDLSGFIESLSNMISSSVGIFRWPLSMFM